MDYKQIIDQSNQLFEQLVKLHQEFAKLWSGNVFLSLPWFIGISLIFGPWILWFIVRKKESADRLLYAGFFVMIVSSFQDVIGIALGLWTYPYNVFPLMPEFLPFDFSSLPVATMLFIQFFPKVKPIYKALVFAAVGSFIFQPFMVWVCLYDNLHWEHYYTFPILVGIYMAANYFTNGKRFEEISPKVRKNL